MVPIHNYLTLKLNIIQYAILSIHDIQWNGKTIAGGFFLPWNTYNSIAIIKSKAHQATN